MSIVRDADSGHLVSGVTGMFVATGWRERKVCRVLTNPATMVAIELQQMNVGTKNIRPAAVAGRFYPADPTQLARMVNGFLEQARAGDTLGPKALIAPHAGYPFSGPIAGSAFRAWTEERDRIRRVVLLGPSHFVDFPGIGLPHTTGFATPFGVVPVDIAALEQLRPLPQVRVVPEAHEREHCLEVELPFLQRTLSDVTIIPLVVGDATDDEVGAVVEALWGGEDTRFVVSSDLSHYHDYPTACNRDRATADAIEALRPDLISADAACGAIAIRGFLKAAAARGLNACTLDLRNSGDTAGPRDSVVGYGAFAFAAR